MASSNQTDTHLPSHSPQTSSFHSTSPPHLTNIPAPVTIHSSPSVVPTQPLSPPDISSPLHIPLSVESLPPLPQTVSKHPMQTRSKSGITKPKLLVAELTSTDNCFSEPLTLQQALKSHRWRKAMEEEYNALIANHTWQLVPYNKDMHLVQNK